MIKHTYFHATLAANVSSIMEQGLIPQIGERSVQLDGEREGVFLFTSEESCEDALANWLGDELDEVDDGVVILKVELPEHFPLDFDVEWEAISRQTIDPSCIAIYNDMQV